MDNKNGRHTLWKVRCKTVNESEIIEMEQWISIVILCKTI